MKKRLICILMLAAMLFASVAQAKQVPALSEDLYTRAKLAVGYLASGAYDKVVTTLPFSDVSPSANEWKNFAERSFTTLSGALPQKIYAVSYWTGNAWKIAVPVFDPVRDDIETLELTSEDGLSFNGYNFASWGQVVAAYQASPYVAWNQEFIASTSVFIENDY